MPSSIFIASWGYTGLAFAFVLVPREYQFIVGLLSPLFREFTSWQFRMFSSKIAGDKENVIHPSNFYMEARHSMFLAITLAGVATPLTSYCIIGMDFALNIYHGWKIVL